MGPDAGAGDGAGATRRGGASKFRVDERDGDQGKAGVSKPPVVPGTATVTIAY